MVYEAFKILWIIIVEICIPFSCHAFSYEAREFLLCTIFIFNSHSFYAVTCGIIIAVQETLPSIQPKKYAFNIFQPVKMHNDTYHSILYHQIGNWVCKTFGTI